MKRSDRKPITRRGLLGSVGLGVGASLLTGCGDAFQESPFPASMAMALPSEKKQAGPDRSAAAAWQYVRLDPAAVAAEAYRLVPEGGCMYALVSSIMLALTEHAAEPFGSFPVHMMRYGSGGVGHWGSVCGAANGAAAMVGLFEQDAERRDSLIRSLFSWYEASELPAYQPAGMKDTEAMPKTVAGSVLCHISVGRWCAASGNEAVGPERKERCRRLTADVTARVVELLNANQREPCTFSGPCPEVKSCLSCHKEELKDTAGQMRCGVCHQELSKSHPKIPSLPLKPSNE